MAPRTYYKPRGDAVLIRPLPEARLQTPGGIHIPPSLKRDFVRAEVLEIGPGRWLDCGVRARADDLEPGQIVLVLGDRKDPRTGQTVQRNLIPASPEEDVFLVREDLIYAIEV